MHIYGTVKYNVISDNRLKFYIYKKCLNLLGYSILTYLLYIINI